MSLDRCVVSRGLGSIALLALAVSLLPSCTGDKSPEGDKDGGAAVESLKEEADELLAKARKAGVDKTSADDYGKAKKLVAEAETLSEEGDSKKASIKLKRAVSSLKGLIGDQEQLSKDKAKLADLKKAAEDSKKKADAKKAAEVSADVYGQAAEELKAADEGMAKATSAKDLAGPRASFNRAKDLFDEAARTATENESFRERADEEKKELARVKDMAKQKGADAKAPQDWITASQAERDAEAAYKSGSFRNAVDQLKQATLAYQTALGQVMSQEEMAGFMAKAAEEEKKYQDEQIRLEKERQEQMKAEAAARKAQAEAKKTVAKKGAKGAKGAEPEAAAGVVLFEGYDVANYPQELDEEDTLFLNDNIAKLSKAGVISYDPDTFAISCDYTVGRDVMKDVERIHIPDPEHLKFETPMMQGAKVKDKAQAQAMAEFSFEGNTLGTIAFPVPFRYYVRVEFGMGIGTMDASGQFGIFTMYNPRKDTGYKSNWMAVGTTKRQKPLGGKYDKVADTWHIKFRRVPYYVEYAMPDTLNPKAAAKGPLESGRFVVKYDAGTKDEAVNTFASKVYTRGQVGFWWSRTKFTVSDLILTGILDREAAVAKLREITKTKKSGGAPAKPAKKPAETAKAKKAEPEEGAGGNGGADGEGVADEKPKKKPAKPSGGFDF